MKVVAIGASAGGIEALRQFFEKTPHNSGYCFVVVLHQAADRKSLLADILARWTAMPVVEADDNEQLQPNTVHVVPPGAVATVKGGVLHLRRLLPDTPREAGPIDTFFNSLAADMGEDVVGVILSGTGHDGALGLKTIKAMGGLTFAQGADGSAPQHAGMPASAIATGAVDIIVPVDQIPGRLLALGDPIGIQSVHEAGMTAAEVEVVRLRICDVLRDRLGHDFSLYKEKTFLRRVQRRMQTLEVASLFAYAELLERTPEETLALFRDLLIGVTTFFRDQAAFEAVRALVIPRLFEGKGASDTVRVWVAGCATGEEAYSLAILLREHMETIDTAPRIQIFATDIDEQAIETARSGRYPATMVAGLSAQRLRRFFTSTEGGYVVSKDIRELCTFSPHSLVRDPPFSRLDMVSCRNLLIYLDTELQSRVIPAFHYALVPGGVLLLGSSETVVRHEGLFVPLDKERRIFIRRDGPGNPLRVPTGAGRTPQDWTGQQQQKLGETRRPIGQVISMANNHVLERFAAPFIVVSSDGTLLHYSSHVGNFLLPALGAPSRNALDMVRRELRLTLRSALREAASTGRPTEHSVTIDPGQEGARALTLVVEPLPGTEPDRSYLVVFNARDVGERAVVVPADGPVVQLERELRDTREQLQSLAEEHQTALEELRSSNEELHSVNEELQSTNEELETSKEEIQSINEELQTVNGQLTAKIDELNRANSDLRNLFESTQVATVFLDQDAIIRGFTPEMCSIYNLIPSDRGRPLTDIVSRLNYQGLRDDMQVVRQTLELLERRVSRLDGTAHYLLRILPYRAPDSTIDGTLITFVDVTSIVQAEQHHRLLVDELNHRVKNILAVVLSLANETIHRSRTMEAFAEVFRGRVQALTAVYSLLSRENWSHVKLRNLLMEELEPFLAREPKHIDIDGPDVALDPRAALALGMVIHELTTNAAKYGALSVPAGELTVTWSMKTGDDGARLIVEWDERHGPPVVDPAVRGFGSVLIERGVAHDLSGTAVIEFRPAGVYVRLVVPWHTVHDSHP